MNTRQPIDWAKYILAFIITSLIFGSVLYVNGLIDSKRVASTERIRDQIALDLLSSETQFNLLKETSCVNIGANALSEELNSLSRKLGYMEANDVDGTNEELVYLKKYYSLLEIKDYLLMSELRTKCQLKPLSILYFYGKKENCPECERTETVLTYLRGQYPELRVYSFDTTLTLSALDTLTSIFDIKDTELPALVIDNKKHIGFKSIEEIKVLIPELVQIDKEREEAEKKAKNATTTTTGDISKSKNSVNKKQ
jgi:glutaredoxin